MKQIVLITISLVIGGMSVTAQKKADYEPQFNKAQTFLDKNENEQALEVLQPLTKVKEPEYAARAFRGSGEAYMSMEDYDKAKEALGKALEITRTIHYQAEEAYCLYLLGRIDAFSGQFEEAKSKGLAGSYIAKAIGDYQLELRINNLLSWTYFATEVDFNRVLEHEGRQLTLVDKYGDQRDKASVYNNSGYDLTVAGIVPIDSTIQLMEVANGIYADLEKNKGRWYTLMNLTWQHRLKGDMSTSKDYGEKSCTQAEKDDDRHAILEACFQLAETLTELDKMSEVKRIYEKGLEWRGDKKDRDSYVFDVYYSRFLWKTGQKAEALSRLEKAIEFLKTSEVFYEMHARAILANYYISNNEFDKAEEQLKVIEEPRHNYIALESRCIAAIARAKLLNNGGEQLSAEALMKFWLKEVKRIDAKQLVQLIKDNNSFSD